MAISTRRHKADRQHIKAQLCRNAHDRPIQFNLLESNSTQFASLGIFVLLIANFILLELFPLSSNFTNFLFTLKQEHYNGHSGASYTSGTPGN